MSDGAPILVAIAQTASGPDKRANIDRAVSLVLQAIDMGARLVALPETFDYRGTEPDLSRIAEPLPGSALAPLLRLASERDVWILAGSVHEADPSGGMPYNTSALISPKGKIAARYRKIHLFDIAIGDRSVTESAKYQSGREIVSTRVDALTVGLTICYDMRFPELYRALADAGSDLVCVPSSFTAPTGEAHWEILLRARAVENQCFIIAPGQAGIGAGGIPTYGNSMIIDPWGRVLARASADSEEVISATLDLEEMARIRQHLPALNNRKLPLIR